MKNCEECKRLKLQLREARKAFRPFMNAYINALNSSEKAKKLFTGVIVTTLGDIVPEEP